MCKSSKEDPYSSTEKYSSMCLRGMHKQERERVATPSKSYPQSFQVRILPMSQSLSPPTLVLSQNLQAGQDRRILTKSFNTLAQNAINKACLLLAARKELEGGTRFSIQPKFDVQMPQLLSVLFDICCIEKLLT